MITTQVEVTLPHLRWRSYNMSLCINGEPELDPNSSSNPSFKKFTEIRNPEPYKLFVLLDVPEDEIYDCTFGMPAMQYWGDARVWWDTHHALAQPSPAARGPRRSLAVVPSIRIVGTTARLRAGSRLSAAAGGEGSSFSLRLRRRDT
jgi:hypothetical protein